MAKALQEALRREKDLGQTVFDGLGKGPNYVSANGPLSPETTNYRREIARRLLALGELYGLDLSSEGGWRNLALCLAVDFLPPFRVEPPPTSGKKQTKPEYYASRMAVMLQPTEDGERRDVATARRLAARELEAETEAFNSVYPGLGRQDKSSNYDAAVKKGLARFDAAAPTTPTDLEAAVAAAVSHMLTLKDVARDLSMSAAEPR